MRTGVTVIDSQTFVGWRDRGKGKQLGVGGTNLGQSAVLGDVLYVQLQVGRERHAKREAAVPARGQFARVSFKALKFDARKEKKMQTKLKGH